MTSPLYREGCRGFANFTDSDRYLLPQRAEWLSVDALLEPLPIPALPTIRETMAQKKPLQEQIDAKRRSFEDIFNSESARLNGLHLRDRYSNEEPEAIATLIELANRRHPIGRRFRDGFRAFVDPNAKVVLIEIQFPDFAKHSFQIDTTAKGKPKYASEAQKKKIVRQCLYSVVIRAGYLASRVLEPTNYKTVAINISQDWFDPATGTPRTGIICSLQAQICEFTALHLDQVGPEACFRHLKGIAVPSFDSISPIRPIFVLNKTDDRFIATKELDSLLAPEANLAAMPWEDFEQLVAQLFEWEFVKEGVEVRVHMRRLAGLRTRSVRIGNSTANWNAARLLNATRRCNGPRHKRKTCRTIRKDRFCCSIALRMGLPGMKHLPLNVRTSRTSLPETGKAWNTW